MVGWVVGFDVVRKKGGTMCGNGERRVSPKLGVPDVPDIDKWRRGATGHQISRWVPTWPDIP